MDVGELNNSISSVSNLSSDLEQKQKLQYSPGILLV